MKVENSFCIYVIKYATSYDSLYMLSDFLITDANRCEKIKWYMNFLKDPEEIETGGDQTYFFVKNNVVIISDQYDEDMPSFLTTRSNMIKILESWSGMHKQRPTFIKITMDEKQNVTFTPLTECKP